MLDRIPERLRTAAEGVAKATQMMADAKSQRNRAAGEPDASYSGLDKEQTAEWQGAEIIETAYRWRRAYHHGTRDEIELQEQCLLDILARHL